MKKTMRQHQLWLNGKPGKRFVCSGNLSGFDFSGTDLRCANLSGANLSNEDLNKANLCDANLNRANLCGANLSYADLICADLSYADLTYADLTYANLRNANLRNANLRNANLIFADLICADLTGANLSKTNLKGINFYKTDLTGTCLDPNNVCNIPNCFEIVNGYAIGYRDRKAGHIDYYRVGRHYSADVFSTSDTECHPGLYICKDIKSARYWSNDIIIVRTKLDQIHQAGNKYRCRWFEVIGEVKEESEK